MVQISPKEQVSAIIQAFPILSTSRLDLNHPPTAVGGISDFAARPILINLRNWRDFRNQGCGTEPAP